MIASKYAHPEIGRRNLETLVAATLEATLLHPTQERAEGLPRRRARRSATRACAAYRKLVYETPGFTDYFFERDADPRDRRAQHRLAPGLAQGRRARSRTCARSPGASAGASAASRCPAGAASARRSRPSSARAASTRKERLALLQRMHRQWPFFRTLLSNLDMVLAKSDLAHRRALCRAGRGQALGKRIFARDPGRVAAHRRDALSLITGETQRLASNPSLARSIEHRFPYLDPLNHLQVELMRRYRAAQRDGDPAMRARADAASTSRSTASRRGCATPGSRGPAQAQAGRARVSGCAGRAAQR